jgi:uncharacterized protein YutE (UPF0331/DUF86 family)
LESNIDLEQEEKFHNFMSGAYAAITMWNRAKEKGYFFECVCLSANIIDSLLRLGLILKAQIENLNSDLSENLLYQGEGDKIITERQVYSHSKDKEIISIDLFDRLEQLYKLRNKVVHRYIICKMTTDDVLEIALSYENILYEVKAAIVILEEKQIELKVGMTETSTDAISQKEAIMISQKHGNSNLEINLNSK